MQSAMYTCSVICVKNTEDTGNKWLSEMISLLCGMNKARKSAMEQGETSFPADEKKLLNRMRKYGHNHLLFLHDFDILFDNNMSEGDLRKVKNRQKMSGGFRKESGHEMYCSILTIIETLKRRKMGILENIRKPFMGTPAIF